MLRIHAVGVYFDIFQVEMGMLSICDYRPLHKSCFCIVLVACLACSMMRQDSVMLNFVMHVDSNHFREVKMMSHVVFCFKATSRPYAFTGQVPKVINYHVGVREASRFCCRHTQICGYFNVCWRDSITNTLARVGHCRWFHQYLKVQSVQFASASSI